MFKCMQQLPNLHRNYFSGATIWGSVHPTIKNILLLNNIDMDNYSAVYTPLDFFGVVLQSFLFDSRKPKNKLYVYFQEQSSH